MATDKQVVYVIQAKPAFDSDNAEWTDWAEDTDAAELLRTFVNSVSGEEIDDVNLYWQVIERVE